MTKKTRKKTYGKAYGRLGLKLTNRKKYQLNTKEFAVETAELINWSIHYGGTKLPSKGAVNALHKLDLDTSPWSISNDDTLKEVNQSISWLSKVAKEVQQGLETDLVNMLQNVPCRFKCLSKWGLMELVTLTYTFQIHDRLKEKVNKLVKYMEQEPKAKEMFSSISPNGMYLN